MWTRNRPSRSRGLAIGLGAPLALWLAILPTLDAHGVTAGKSGASVTASRLARVIDERTEAPCRQHITTRLDDPIPACDLDGSQTWSVVLPGLSVNSALSWCDHHGGRLHGRNCQDIDY